MGQPASWLPAAWLSAAHLAVCLPLRPPAARPEGKKGKTTREKGKNRKEKGQNNEDYLAYMGWRGQTLRPQYIVIYIYIYIVT